MKKKRYIFISRKGNRPQPIDYSKEYFFIEDVSGEENVLTIKRPTYSSQYVKVSVSVDKDNWVDLGSTQSGDLTYAIPANGKLFIKGVNDRWGVNNTSPYNNRISCSKPFNVCGNIMSLLYGDEYIDKDVLQETYTFSNLFYESNVVDASNIVLPATTLADYCYSAMFQYCEALTTAPSLPATQLASSCYSSMFYGCTSLATIPSLPATEMKEYCYNSMFGGCSSLITAPSLPATTLAENCYSYMFFLCTSLTTAPKELPATTLAENCYNSMFQNCKALTTAPALPATEMKEYCYSYMFYGCEALTKTPSLPATQLAYRCYGSMFGGCKSLVEAPELPATLMSGYGYDGMFKDCISLTKAPALPATTLVLACYSNMFTNCISLIESPELPTTKLAENCYRYMFDGCRALNKVTIYAEDISATGCLTEWLLNVSETGTIYSMSLLKVPDEYVPEGWTIVYPAIEAVAAEPSEFSLKSYQKSIDCEYTLRKYLEDGRQVTEQGLRYVETGENTGDEPRVFVETVHENPLATITIIQTANDPEPPTIYSVEKPDDVTYGFKKNADGYYESTNKGINNSYSYAIVYYKGFETLTFSCINYAESNWDYGLISKEDVVLDKGDNTDSDTKLTKNFKGQQSPDPVIVTIPSDGGEHFITIKYIKDGSDHANNDSLQFKVLED